MPFIWKARPKIFMRNLKNTHEVGLVLKFQIGRYLFFIALMPTPSVLMLKHFMYLYRVLKLYLYQFWLVLCNEIKYDEMYKCWPVTMSPRLIRSTWHSLHASRNINPVLNRIVQGGYPRMQYYYKIQVSSVDKNVIENHSRVKHQYWHSWIKVWMEETSQKKCQDSFKASLT